MTKITVFSRLSKRSVIITFSLTISLVDSRELKKQYKVKCNSDDQIRLKYCLQIIMIQFLTQSKKKTISIRLRLGKTN